MQLTGSDIQQAALAEDGKIIVAKEYPNSHRFRVDTDCIQAGCSMLAWYGRHRPIRWKPSAPCVRIGGRNARANPEASSDHSPHGRRQSGRLCHDRRHAG
jgi:hypothetical protein